MKNYAMIRIAERGKMNKCIDISCNTTPKYSVRIHFPEGIEWIKYCLKHFNEIIRYQILPNVIMLKKGKEE